MMIERGMRLLAVLALVACHQDAAPAKPVAQPSDAAVAITADAGRPRLFDDAEIAGFENGFLAVLDANAKRSCAGPQVIGAVEHGPSAPDVVVIVEATGDLAACYARADPKVIDAMPDRSALDHDCGTVVEAAVRRAAARDGGCSPYQVGVRADPKSMVPVFRLASLIGIHARIVARKDAVKALAIALDGLRVAQDLLRGHVDLLTAMVAASATRTIAQAADDILGAAKFSRAQLADVELALDHLIEAEPPFTDILSGELEAQQLNLGMAGMEGDAWTPPGGWGDMRSDPAGTHVADPRDEAAAEFLAAAQNATVLIGACPATSLKSCHDAIPALPSRTAPIDVPALYADFAAAAAKGDLAATRARIRGAIIDILASAGRPAYTIYVEKYGQTLSGLAELRLHAELAHTKPCPNEAALAKTPFAELAAPPNLGEPMVLHAGKDTVEVRGLFVADPWTLHCR